PFGIYGARIWYFISGIIPGALTEPPIGMAGWQLLADDTCSPYIHQVANAPMTISYKAQWFDKRMRLGPLCDPVTVTISG
ncbi:MAG: hypothetical protein HY769_08950, partial [Candidatus Stahlbacteria bacterium]|nr:hypothetical protein [Candidatus Stahlbacteria bacterium]